MAELLQSQNKTFTNEELLLMDEQRKLFLEMESTPGDGAVKIIEMTSKDAEYYINLVDKALAGFEKTDSNFERLTPTLKEALQWVKCYQTELHATGRKSKLMWQTSFLCYFKKLPQPLQPSATTTLIS